MIALLCFVLAVLAAPFKSKSLLEAENAALRHQLTVLRRKVHGRVGLTNSDRLCVPKTSSKTQARWIAVDYDGLPGEGWFPVPLPVPVANLIWLAVERESGNPVVG
jgi:hypothetical protein